jgi:hypothetical protein
MSRGLFRLVGVRSVCWVVRDCVNTVSKKKSPASDIMKIRLVGAEMKREERRKDRRTNGHDEEARRFSRRCERI